ncbi:hypothetical protein [Rhizobium sp. IBUN]|uniref:hypothetical protein n=1 Tax=Rhizobium sp. IBUN TaxID=1042326 RepID=UPI000425570E|nr:hypothetical protein [Rhizobium sp. IBUN]
MDAAEIFGANAAENADKVKAAMLLVFILRFMDRGLSLVARNVQNIYKNQVFKHR